MDRNRVMITPTQAEKDCWGQVANAAYRVMRNDIGHKFSVAASITSDMQITAQHFDKLQTIYRRWLCDNEFPDEQAFSSLFPGN